MKKNIFQLLIAFFVFGVVSAQQTPVTIKSELEKLLNINNLPDYNEGSAVKQISSYDRKGGNNDGFEGTWSFVSRNPDSSLVLFEAAGKGVIERIWTPTPTDDTLDFYFNGSAVSSFSIKFNDLFNGKVYPFVNPVAGRKVGGWYSYLPIPYANGCRIVFRGKKMLFHQIQYREYETGGPVANFNPVLDEDAKSTLEKVVNLWTADKPSPRDLNEPENHMYASKHTMKPGDVATFHHVQNPGRITAIELNNADQYEGLKNSLDIRITWDGEKTPAVYAPVADFFGYAFGAVSMQGLLAGVRNKTAYCYIPMPFDKSAKIELIYRKDGADQKTLNVECNINVSSHRREAGKEGKFYAYWKKESPAQGEPYVFLEGSGKGHYVGTILLSQGKDYEQFTEFFEGDDSTVLDDKHLLHGTGSEDYFNGGWYAQAGGWVERKGAPLHGCLDYSLPFSRTGGYRFYMLDKLPFQQKIYHSIEHGPVNNNRKVEYTSIAMYYADKPLVVGKAPTNLTSRIFVPDTLSFYSRLMDHLTYKGAAKLINGNAELDKNLEGTVLVDVRELSKGNYKMFMHARGAAQIMAGINSAAASLPAAQKGTKADNVKENPAGNTSEWRDVYIGTLQISDTNKPVEVNLKTSAGKLMLNRIYLVKANAN